MTHTEVSVEIALPGTYRPGDIIAFHGRDPVGGSEQVSATGLCKGLVWDGAPARLDIVFQDQGALVRLHSDGGPVTPEALTRMVRRMLGLDQDIDAFEAMYRDHPELGRLIRGNGGLRLPVTATPFEALVWAITGQQISVSAAIAIRRRLIQACDLRHCSGMLCPPDAAALVRLGADGLRGAGFSQAKADTVLAVSRAVLAKDLNLEQSPEAAAMAALSQRLAAMRGIGPWTVSYTLLRGHGWLDGSLHGDVAVRRALQTLLRRTDKISPREAETWLADFRPWRALVAAHLWASLSAASF